MSKAKIKDIPVSRLVFDESSYIRPNVDAENVRMLREAIRAGAKVPPIIVCAKTYRIVDGIHRHRAMRLEKGDDAKIMCEFVIYKDDSALFLDAIRRNSCHGRKLVAYDRVHIAHMADDLKVDPKAVATALNMTVDRFTELTIARSAKVNGDTVRIIPIKRTIRHMKGKTLTDRQQVANKRLSGMNQAFYANQLIELIESELLDREDETLMTSLEKLHGLLEEMLVAV